jgi:hypothetical protein
MPSRTISKEFRTVVMQQLSSRILLHCWPSNICTISYRLSTISLLPWWYVICYHIVTLLITIALVVCYYIVTFPITIALMICYIFAILPFLWLLPWWYIIFIVLLVFLSLLPWWYIICIVLLVFLSLLPWWYAIFFCIVTLFITIALMTCFIFSCCCPSYHYCPDDVLYFCIVTLLITIALICYICPKGSYGI